MNNTLSFQTTARHREATKQVTFIDTGLPDYQTLLDGLPEGMDVVLVSPDQDGIQLMAEWAQSHSGYSAIHVVGHGYTGAQQLGSAVLSGDTLEVYKAKLNQIGSALTENGDILLYGCNVAAEKADMEFIGKLAQLTGADIAASDDLTGAEGLGGDWVLEQLIGEVTAKTLANQSFTNVLLEPSDQNFNSISGPQVYGNTTTINGLQFDQSNGRGTAITVVNDTQVDLSNYYVIHDSSNDNVLMFGTNSNGAPSVLGEMSPGAADFRIKSESGEEFKLVSMEADAGIHSPQPAAEVYTVSGYKNGQLTVFEDVDFSSSDGSGSISYAKKDAGYGGTERGGTLTFNNEWQDIDEIRFTNSDVNNYSFLVVDNLDFSAAVSSSDLAPPTFDQTPTASNISTTGLDLTVDINEGGTIYYAVVADGSSAPSVTQVKNGQDSTGSAAIASDSRSVSSGDYSHMFSLSGLDSNTAYDIYVVAQDDEGTPNIQASATLVNVATAALEPTITSATYDAATGLLVVTGSDFTAHGGATNDVVANKITLTGEGGATYTLTDTANVEVDSATQFTLSLSATDKAAVNQILNKNGTASTGSTTYDLDGAAGFIAASAAVSDTGTNGITVSNVAPPTITSATYDYNSNTVTVSGTNFVKKTGASNDVDLSKLTFTGEGGATYALTSTTDVEITSDTSFTFTLSGNDIVGVESLLNKDGATADSGATYNIAGAAGFMTGDSTAAADTSGSVTVSNYAVPTITSSSYDLNTRVLTLTGTNFVNASGAANDIVANKFTVTGEGGATYTLTDTSNVEITSDTSASVTLSATDAIEVASLWNKDGTSSATSSTTYNLAVADDWMAGAPAANSIADATTGVTVSNYMTPTVTSATYNHSTNTLVVTGSNFVKNTGAANDVDVSRLTLTGEGGATYTLTDTADVEIDSATQFTLTLSSTDIINVEALLNKNGSASYSATTYNLEAAEDWMTGAPAGNTIADGTGNGITVSNYSAPTITSATYDWNTGQLVLTGTNFVAEPGASNDIDVTKLTVTGQVGNTYTLTSTNVEVSSTTAATVTLNTADQLNINGLLNSNGTSADDATTYNVAAAEDWMAGAPASSTIADTTGNAITVSNVSVPSITSAAYDYSSNTLVVTGTNLVKTPGATNDIDVSALTITGEGGATYTLSTSSDVEITTATSFSVALSGSDIQNVESLLNADGTSSATSGTTFNLAAADNWLQGSAATADISDSTNGITVSNYSGPAVTSVTYDWSTGQLVLTGTNFVSAAGANNDIDVSKLTITGEGNNTYTLTSSSIDIASSTSATVTLSSEDQLNAHGLLNKDGTASANTTSYNLALAEDWMSGSPASVTVADSSNGITVNNVTNPTITSAVFDADTMQLHVTGTNLFKKTGGSNDVDVSLFTITGGNSETYTLVSSSDVEITSATSFTVTLTGIDSANIYTVIDQLGSSSSYGTVYNLGAADGWLTAAEAAVDISDETSNSIDVIISPKILSATYNVATGALVVSGSNIQANNSGADIDASTITLTGEGGETFTLSDTGDVERDSASQFTLTLGTNDQAAVAQIFNKSGSTSTGGTAFEISVADDWNTIFTTGDTSDSNNSLTVNNVPAPTITSATLDVSSGSLVVTGTNLTQRSGMADIDASRLVFTGEDGETYQLTDTADVEITSGTSFTLNLSATDQAALSSILNKNGTSSTGGTTYNLAALEDWALGADSSVNIADETGNGLTLSNVATPSITSATYNEKTGVLTVTGQNFSKLAGANNDIDVSKLTITGEAGANHTLTSTSVDITSATQFTVSLNSTDLTALAALINKAGTASEDNTTYNLAAAEDWAAGADASVTLADLTANGITATVNIAPTAADTTESMSYNASYTFTADDFGFSDVDTDDTLDHITIKTLPAAGHLTLDGLVITAVDTQVTLTQLTEGKLLFVPATNGTGDAYSSFTFTVSDGTGDSVTPNTVTLNVGARPTPPPTPEPEPEPQPESEEDLVTSPTGVSGDGNDDGVPDRDQADVASIPFRDTPVPSQEPNADPIYVSLTGGTTDGKSSATGSGVTLNNVRQLDKPDDEGAANLDMPLGLIAFDADIGEVGGTETFSLYVDDSLSVNGYWKQDASGEWVNLASADYSGKVVLEGSKLRLDFQITDGGEFDADGLANGKIADPGALAFGSDDYTDLVQSLYIAYYQRPADSAGLDYWVDYLIEQDGSLENVVDAFANSAESQALYGEITNTSISGFLGDLYRALFDRSPEVDGLMFYRNAFLAGEYEDGRPATAGTLMLDILQGAQNSDAELVDLKLGAARTFTWLLDPDQDGEVMATFDAGDLNDVRDWLHGLAGDDAAPGVGAIYSLIKDEVAEYGEPITLTGANGATELLF